MNDLKKLTDDYWVQKLTPEQFKICRLKGTEPPYSGKYHDHKEKGWYYCVACGAPLFSSTAKFHSRTGWPSFYEPIKKEAVELQKDVSYGMRRTEVVCQNCGSHLGHVFADGPAPTGQRYCINSTALNFAPQKITPHLWFDKEAKEAAVFYTSIFKDSKIKDTTTLHNTPSGSVDIVVFDLCGQAFMAISAGPLFKFNPSISFLVACGTKEEVDALWAKLSEGGTALMELDKYPFSEKYGWVQDKYGLSWQVMFMGERKIKQKITPTLMFVGAFCGKAEEAINFYASVFNHAKVGDILRYGKDEKPDKEGTIKHAAFTLEGQEFAAMDSAPEHNFTFNEAISFVVHCDTQEEIDYYWKKLSAVPEAEQCGWLKDRYGLSWQIVPVAIDKMMKDKDEGKIARVTEAFLKMKKFDIETLKRAYEGK